MKQVTKLQQVNLFGPVNTASLRVVFVWEETRVPRGKQPVSPGDQMAISHGTAMYRTQLITVMQYK